MKQFALFCLYYLSFAIPWMVSLSNDTTEEMATTSVLNVTCDPLDSLTLVTFYNATNGGPCLPSSPGPGWNIPWTLANPVCTWNGITLNAAGRVIAIELNNSGLTGNIPADLAVLTELQELKISNNCLTGTVPDELGDLVKMRQLWIDGNDLVGTIPESLCNMVSLMVFFLDNNTFTGTFPACFNDLDALGTLDMFFNCFDSLPDLTGAISLTTGRLKVQNNKLTFDDLLPNINDVGTFYAPQDSVCITVDTTVTTGSVFKLSLGIDANITTNSYQWYKDGVLFGPPSNANNLVFDPVTFDIAGVYHCEVRNPAMPLLTLYSRCKTVNVVCGNSTFEYVEEVCSGFEITIGGVTYNAANPSFNNTFTGADQFGCDSIVNINLTFNTPPPTPLDTILCAGESITVNGTVYNEANPSGTEMFGIPDQFNCDSSVLVNVAFYPPAASNFSTTICADDTITIAGMDFHSLNATGQVIIGGASFHGCDSIVNINLNFFPLSTSTLTDSYCAGQDIIINGTTYNTGNPSGTETFLNASWRGCDSIVMVDLNFGGGVTNTINEAICEGQSIIVNGTVYDCANLTGTETIVGGSFLGCDSSITVALTCYEPPHGTFSMTVCPNESFVYNGTTYDINNTPAVANLGGIGLFGCDSLVDVSIGFYSTAFSILNATICANETITVGGNPVSNNGPVVINGGSFHGCDSTVFVTLSTLPLATNSINSVLCPGSSITVNGTEYNEGNLTGSETIIDGAFNGCDSVITIAISYGAAVISQTNEILCDGDSLVIGTIVLNASNTMYTDTIIGGSFAGCDSITNINISYYAPSISQFSPSICTGDFLEFGGEIIDVNNPSDTIIVGNGSYTGCDSTIMVTATFTTIPTGNFTTTLCAGESIVINGTTYGEFNTSGMETIPTGSFNGCDTSFTVSIDFYPAASSTVMNTLCDGESLIVGGVTLDASHPSDTIIIPNASFQGCDSMVIINLEFYTPSTPSNISFTLCEGESITVDGVTLNASNPSETIIIPGADFHGCDSTVIANLAFYPPATSIIDYTLCFGQSIIVNGTTYNQSNPTGTETFMNSSFHGCDSIVTIDLGFNSSVQVTIDDVFCDPTAEVIVNMNTYNILMPMGVDTMLSFSGCDSIVTTNLTYPDSVFVYYNNLLCPGESLLVNGVTFNEAMPSGTVVESGASVFGCDVYHVVDLSFYAVSESYLNETLCFGEETIINGVLFDASHVSDTIVLSNAAYTNCDSSVIVAIDFYPEIVLQIDSSLCEGQVVIVNGNTYDFNTPNGTEVMTNVNGCDSTVHINLTFGGAVFASYTDNICEGDEIIINGTIYNMDNPMGSDTFPDASFTGCDSILNILISFIPPSYNNIDTTLCTGEELLINNIIYNSSNLSGMDTLVGASYTGCDSILTITVDYFPLSENTIDTVLCNEEMFVWDGIEYPDNTVINDIITGGSYTGCDSMLTINVVYREKAESDFTDIFCPGEELVLHGILFNENNLSGEIVLNNVSFSGCDSTITVNISYYQPAGSLEELSICQGDSVLWNGQNLTLTGLYEDTLAGQSFHGCDSIVMLDLEVVNPFDFGLANAGADVINCGENISLSANLPSGVSGLWMVMEGAATIANPTQPNTTLSEMDEENIVLIWTLSNDLCPNYDTDTLQIMTGTIPDAIDDNYTGEAGILEIPINILENDSYENIQEWYFNLLSTPSGNLENLGDGIFNYIATDDLLGGLISFQYELCNEDCPEVCDTATVRIQLVAEELLDFPNTITANGDGVNDFFIIPDIADHPDQFSKQELIIFNRWGDVVYTAKPYLNNWGGTNQDGKELPQGTYYYVLRLDVGAGIIYRGDVTILK